MTTTPDAVHQDVERYYAAHARNAGSACCDKSSDEACCGTYPVELLESVPADIASFSLGCGPAGGWIVFLPPARWVRGVA